MICITAYHAPTELLDWRAACADFNLFQRWNGIKEYTKQHNFEIWQLNVLLRLKTKEYTLAWGLWIAIALLNIYHVPCISMVILLCIYYVYWINDVRVIQCVPGLMDLWVIMSAAFMHQTITCLCITIWIFCICCNTEIN